VTSLCPQNAELQRNLSSAAVLRRAQRHKARSSSCLSGASCSPRRRARRLPGPKQGRRPSSTRAPHATTPSSPATAPFEQPRATQRSTHRSADLLLLLLLQVQQLQCMQPHGSTALTTSTARPITHALALVSALICRVFFPLAHTHTSLSLSLSLSPRRLFLSLGSQRWRCYIHTTGPAGVRRARVAALTPDLLPSIHPLVGNCRAHGRQGVCRHRQLLFLYSSLRFEDAALALRMGRGGARLF